jgi:hypothetical protein
MLPYNSVTKSDATEQILDCEGGNEYHMHFEMPSRHSGQFNHDRGGCG